ncbi:MAG TPA: zinc-dependent metalloprotease [Mycobacteriales bacterium]|jgi:putative hydrolase|nr:zinc-dependent metalloprotease [Mycobacteriales bacterium]
MTDNPFGFNVPSEGGDDPQRPGGAGDPMSNPTGGPTGGAPYGLPEDIAGKIPLFAELQKLMSWQGGPVNWDLARQTAISSIAGSVRDFRSEERSGIIEALRLADMWLDPATELPSGVTATEAWSRVEWVEKTLPVWSTLCDPVAARVVGAMSSSLPPEAQAQAGPLMGMMSSMGGMMFGAQVGQALAQLAGEVLSSTDVGLPLGPAGTAVLLPENVTEFGSGLELPAEEVRLFLALRESAHHRLFSHVPWLKQRLLSAIDTYARGITVDTGKIEEAMTQIDPGNPESMQEALSSGMFEPEESPEQQVALRRLETLLALIEGWVDAVVAQAATDRLPGADALRETLRRRRATGGPAEQTFATLVGLELRPRRLRDAATLWQALTTHRGVAGRDAVWAHPDLLPTTDDLDDPEKFAASGDDGPISIEDFED